MIRGSMLSQTAEYALRAVVWLAAHTEPLTTDQIADATQVPRDYLSKVLKMLGRAKLVRSQSGPGGGFRLAQRGEDLSVLEVVNAIEPMERITKCPLNNRKHRGQLCPLHRRIDQALATVEAAFRGCTVADLVNEDPNTKPLCERKE
jgi:Rrf2 family protein